MKKTIILISILCMLGLSGCKKSTNNTVTYDWNTYATYDQSLTNDDISVFYQITSNIIGINYTPIKLIAVQFTNGMNYAFLAQGTTLTSKPSTDYYIITIYDDFKDTLELKAINKIDPNNLKANKQPGNEEEIVMRWMIANDQKSKAFKEDTIENSFNKVKTSNQEIVYEAIQLLASDNESKPHYALLCLGNDVQEGSPTGFYVIIWKDGESEIISSIQLDLEYYTSRQ